MTDENNSNQGDNEPAPPPPPEVVQLDPNRVQKDDTGGDLEK